MLRVLEQAWRRWLKIAEILGNIQMMILLSLIYWTLVAFVAIPFKLLADPLARRRIHARWVQRQPNPQILDSMRRQG